MGYRREFGKRDPARRISHGPKVAMSRTGRYKALCRAFRLFRHPLEGFALRHIGGNWRAKGDSRFALSNLFRVVNNSARAPVLSVWRQGIR